MNYGFLKDKNGNKIYINDNSIYHEGKNLRDVMQNKTVQVSATEPTENDKNKVWFQKTKNLLNCNGFASYNETNVAATANYTNNLLNYINVTKSGSTSKTVFILLTTFDFINDTGTYILSGCPSSGSMDTWQLYLKDETSNNDVSPRDEGNGASVTITKGHQYSLYIRLNSDKTFSDLKFFPMLRVSTNTDDTYEPYCQDNMYILNNNAYEKFIPQNEIYSTNEQVIGKWIDGKPLYRKVLNITNPADSNTDYKDVADLNISTVVHLYGYYNKTNTGKFSIPFYDSSANYCVMFVSKDNKLRGRFGQSSGILEAKVILEYTKTTD